MLNIAILDAIRNSNHEYITAIDIANHLINIPSDEMNRWNVLGRNLLAAILIHAVYTNTDPLTTLRKFSDLSDILKPLLALRDASHDPEHVFGWMTIDTNLPTATHPTVTRAVYTMFGTMRIEWSGIWVNAAGPLRAWIDNIDDATANLAA